MGILAGYGSESGLGRERERRGATARHYELMREWVTRIRMGMGYCNSLLSEHTHGRPVGSIPLMNAVTKTSWQLSANVVTKNKRLGEGAFGEVRWVYGS